MPIIANTTSGNTFSAVRAQLNSVTKRINAFAGNESTLYANTINANVVLKISGTDIRATFAQNTYVKSVLANTNSFIKSQLANTNASIATQASRITLVNTNLTGTNTALRTLINDRLQVANAAIVYQTKTVERAALANTNSRINLINTNLTGTNTALRLLISDRLQIANAATIYQTKTVERAALANTNASIATKLTSTYASTTAASLTWGGTSGQILRNENSEFAFGLYNASPYALYIQGRNSSSTARDIVLQPLGGNIGIGTTSPAYKLDVNGYVGATRYYLTNTNSVYAYGDGSGFAFTGAGYAYFNQTGNLYSQSRIQARSGISDDANATLTLYGGTGGYTTITGSARSPIFYDSDDTNYYVNPNGYSSMYEMRLWGNTLYIRGGSPTIFFTDTDHQSAMLHNNGNLFYILRGGVDSTGWATVGSGNWPCYWNLTNNDCVMGGNISASYNIIAYASDRRLKENIAEIPNALDKIKQIRGVTFDWNDDAEVLGFTPETKYNDLGVIAQEIQAVLPQAVKPAPFDQWFPDPSGNYEQEYLDQMMGTSRSGENYLTVQLDKIVPLLIEGIKEQQKQIEELREQIEILKRVK
jgi:hypothetical protein